MAAGSAVDLACLCSPRLLRELAFERSLLLHAAILMWLCTAQSMPTVHAFVALATVSAQRGLKAVESDVSSGGIALANSEHTQKAADYYVIALGLVPEDYYLTPMYCWKRLEL